MITAIIIIRIIFFLSLVLVICYLIDKYFPYDFRDDRLKMFIAGILAMVVFMFFHYIVFPNLLVCHAPLLRAASACASAGWRAAPLV